LYQTCNVVRFCMVGDATCLVRTLMWLNYMTVDSR
jgi:hypothetical protein